ncbi:MAG: transporter permease [Bacillales bacterium]|nr:transporter permease [Bacillales bacterium]
MFWRMLIKTFSRGIKSKLLAIVTIAFGASLAGAMITVSLDVGDKVNKELKAYGANLMVEQQRETIPAEIGGVNINPLKGNEYMDEKNIQKVKTIFWANNILAFAPYLEAQSTINDEKVTLIGTYFNKEVQIDTGEKLVTGIKSTKPFLNVKGKWVDDDQAGNSVLVGKSIANKYKLNPNDSFDISVKTEKGVEKLNLKVSGIVEGGNEDEEKIYGSLKLVQNVLNLPGKVEKLEVSALTTPENELAKKAEKDSNSLSSEEFEKWYCTAYVSAIAYQIEEAIPGAVAKPILKVASSEGFILTKIQLLMGLLTITALISSALGISSLMTTRVLERSKEIGLLKAIGADDWQVILLFLVETSITGLIGGLVGYGLGLGFAEIIGQSVFGTSMSFNILVIPIVLILSVGIAIIGSFSAIRIMIKLRG